MEEEKQRANILEMNPDGSGLRVFASGLRNPVGMDWEPETGTLWTAVNERDELGDDLVPDYITSVEARASTAGPTPTSAATKIRAAKASDPTSSPRRSCPTCRWDRTPRRSASSSIAVRQFPEKYRGGAFIGQRGSWNRSEFVGYRVAFVPFKDGKPAGEPEDFLTGFLASDTEAYGRPVGVAVAADGSLLVADEPGNVVWRVSATAR